MKLYVALAKDTKRYIIPPSDKTEIEDCINNLPPDRVQKIIIYELVPVELRDETVITTRKAIV